jgi:hypothetical protein
MLPIKEDNVTNLPKWPQYIDGEQEFLDMESFSQMTVRTKLRETHCEFLKDPEGYVEKVQSDSERNLLKPAWLIMAAICSLYLSN